MSSTLILDRPARQAPPDKLASDTAPLPSAPLPLDLPLSLSPAPEAALTPATASSPALADILFDDYPLLPPDSEASAAAPFKIDSFDKAAWAASKVFEAQARIAERAALALAYKDRIDSWLADSNKADEASASYLSMLLKPYVEEELARNHSHSRTLSLPTAPASLRKAPDRVTVLKEAEAMAYLEANHPSAVITKKAISLSSLRSLIFTEGEAVPGVEAELGSDSLYIKPRS
jgi:hypothetical protein